MSADAPDVFVHPHALNESRHVGDGTRLWAFVHVMDGAKVGRFCNLGEHVFIERGARVGDRVTLKNQVSVWDGVTIEDDAFIGPGVIFTNDRYPRSPRMTAAHDRYAHPENWLESTRVGRGASIGAGAIVLCGLSIGAYAMIGAGSLVSRDAPPHAWVVGRPGRIVGWACLCGRKLTESFSCPACGRRYEKSDDGLCLAGDAG